MRSSFESRARKVVTYRPVCGFVYFPKQKLQSDKTVRQLLRATYQREVAYYSDKRRKAEVALREATEEVGVLM